MYRHSNVELATKNLACSIITSKIPLIQYDSLLVLFCSGKDTLKYMSGAGNMDRNIFEMWSDCVPTIFVPVNYGMLAPDLQFMLGISHGHSPWLSSTSASQKGKAKYLPQLQMQFFEQATVSDANSPFKNLYWSTSDNAINCTFQSFLSIVVISSWANNLRSKQPILSMPSYAFLTVFHKVSPNSQWRFYRKGLT